MRRDELRPRAADTASQPLAGRVYHGPSPTPAPRTGAPGYFAPPHRRKPGLTLLSFYILRLLVLAHYFFTLRLFAYN